MPSRPYQSQVRAAAAEATAERIVRATLELAYERNAIDMTLEQVAARAGTSVQTVLRKFGSRDGLLIAATQAGSQEVVAERQPVPGDRDASIAALVEHYEQRGRFVLRILAQDESWARLITDSGKLVHRAWVEEVFAADLPDAGPQRDELVDLLVVATDVYAWKLLRLDRGLDAATTASRIRTLTLRILAPTP